MRLRARFRFHLNSGSFKRALDAKMGGWSENPSPRLGKVRVGST